MKRLFTLLLSVFVINSINAQAVLSEQFSYTAGGVLTDNNWTQIGTTATNPITVTSPGLTYAGHPGSGVGNAATMTTSGQDIYRDGTSSISSGNAYVSFLLNVASAQTGDYFLALLPTTSTTNFTARTFVKSTGTGFQIGISKSTETTVYAAPTYTFNTTYLVVVKYNFATGSTTDDQISLFVFSSGIPASEPTTPDAGPTAGTAADAASIGRVALRQGTGTSAPGLTIDGIRLTNSWLDVIAPLSLKLFSASLVENKASLTWATSNEINVNGFSIERSANGKEFNEVGFVKANNASSNQYAFNDAVAITGATYFRLKMTDKDGSFKYSQVVVLNSKKSIKLDVYPNPVSNTITLSHTKADNSASIRIVTVEGKTIATYNVQLGATQTSIDATKLTRGNYLVVFENEGAKSTAQFIKQ